MAYVPPHLKNVKKVTFNREQVIVGTPEHHRDKIYNTEEILEVEIKCLHNEKKIRRKENTISWMRSVDLAEEENKDLEKELVNLRNVVASLRTENQSMKINIEKLNKDVELYKGDRDECVPKSQLDDTLSKLHKTSSKYGKSLEKLRNIEADHRNDTDSLRKEINILNEKLNKYEKDREHLSSNIRHLVQRNQEMEEIIERMTKEVPAAQVTEEQNKNLIAEDWINIRTSLRYILDDEKLKIRFKKDTRLDLAAMKLTLDILEKLDL